MESVGLDGQAVLIERVLAPGLCVGCGACVGLCPYQAYKDGRVIVMDHCRAGSGRCVQLCPQLAEGGPEAIVDQASQPIDEPPLGPCLEVHMARAAEAEVRKGAQYGGVVSALLLHALEEGLITAAVLTDKGASEAPAGVIAEDRERILQCAGSRYSASGGLARLNHALSAGMDRLAVVGLPCQMRALERMARMKPDGETRDRCVRLKIGLFCTWALDYRSLRRFLRQEGAPVPIRRYDIPPPPAAVFEIETDEAGREFPLDTIRPAIQKGCGICPDMTAEAADLSVGAAEGYTGWNTLLVRNDNGRRLLESALAAGRLELKPLPADSLEHLQTASANKRRRGIVAAAEVVGGPPA